MIRPEGWEKHPLEKLATFQTGISKSSNRTGRMVSIPYLRVANVQDGYIDLREIKEIDVPESMTERYLLSPLDVLMTEGGDFDKLGRGSVWQGEISPCAHQNHVFVVRPDRAKLLPYFLSYQTGSAYGKNYFVRCSKQSTNLASINLSQLKGFPVLLPPVPEQQSIVAILSTWDEAIEKLEKLIAAKHRRKQGLMQRLLTGRFQLAAFRNQPWRKRDLGEFFTEHRTINKSGEELTILSCSKIYGIIPQSEVFGKRLASKDLGRYKIVGKGDLVYDPMLLWDASIGFSERVDRGVISPAYATFHFRPGKGDWRFFRHLFQTHYMKHQYKVISRGTNVRRRKAMPEDFLRVAVRMPTTTEEQGRIAGILGDADLQIRLLEAQRDALQTQKRGLMQKLLTGQWRVAVEGN
ncbi:MAG: restriction endonuclease subunit S [Magnetococcales bacterium]|nr:restriction endonuclease subunit S [Magnetococcales bacterium]